MPLTRLDNLISSKTGKYLYVSPDDYNASDALDNRGNTPLRPFVSIQRAFLEVARFSYLPNVDNDRFDQFTIMLAPGNHYIDNRPGVANVEDIPTFQYNEALQQWEANEDVSFDLSDPDNILYRFNGRDGGATIPRGTSLVGTDLRRTQLRALYVPDPADKDVPRCALFNVTGGCYFWQFTILDGDLSSNSPLYDGTVGRVYTQPNDTTNRPVPEFSHHKITNFVFADREDLGLLYRKIAKAFGDYQDTIDDVYVEGSSTPVSSQWSEDVTYNVGDRIIYNGNAFVANAVVTGIDPESDDTKWTRLVIRGREFDYRVQENRIVGPLSDAVFIDSIKLIDGVGTDVGILTLEVRTKINHGFFPGQYVAVTNNNLNNALNGVFAVYNISTNDPKVFYYRVPFTAQGLNLTSGETYTATSTIPLNQTATVQAEVDSVESASPYVFNCSIRSTWGICGIWADGRKATGFKSMVIAQYTGVSLQRDDRAFIRYDEFSNTWNQAPLTDAFATTPYHIKGDAYWKDDWRNFHVRASDDSFIQNVSIFAVGFADHFLLESGGDMSITNSNSNFGNTSMHSVGYKGFSFNQDKGGYITDIIPPQELKTSDKSKQQYYPIQINLTNDATNTSRVYLAGDAVKDPENRPAASVSGYRIGARVNEQIKVKLNAGTGESGPTEKSAVLNPSGFKRWATSLTTLNPAGASFTTEYNLQQDAANLIEANQTFIQSEAFGYILEKYPYLQNISYVNPNITSETGRYRDASNLIKANRQEIIDTAYNEMVTAFPGFVNPDVVKCKRDLGYIIDAIANDLYDGGNAHIVEATQSYFGSNGQILSNGLSGEQTQSVFAFNRVRDLCKLAIANMLSSTSSLQVSSITSSGTTVTVTCSSPHNLTVNTKISVIGLNQSAYNGDFTVLSTGLTATQFQYTALSAPSASPATGVSYISTVTIDQANRTTLAGKLKNASDLIFANKQQIVDAAYVSSIPSDTNGTKCKRDIGYVVSAVANDLNFGGNEYTIAAIKEYFNGNSLLSNGVQGEVTQTVAAFNNAREQCKLAINNQLNVKDLTIKPDPATGSNTSVNSCADVKSTIDNLFGLVTTTLQAGNLDNLATVNNGLYDCANVRSTIDTLSAILTTAISSASLTSVPAPNPGLWSRVSENSKCKRDIGYIVEAIVADLRLGGNVNTVNAAKAYYIGVTQDTDGVNDGFTLDYIENELNETLDAYNYVRDLCISSMRNHNTYMTVNTANSSLVTVPSTVGLAVGMKVVGVNNIPSTTGTSALTNYNDQYEELVDGKVVPKSSNISTAYIPADTYIKRIVNSTQIELGVRGSKLNYGTTKTAVAGTGVKVFFQLEEGIWTSSIGPSVDNTVIQDYVYSGNGECSSVYTTIGNYFGIISTILQNGVNAVTATTPTADTALLSQRATAFTLQEIQGENLLANPHNLETGTPVRLVPRAKPGSNVDKRLVRLPKGFSTNTKYYVIAPGRRTQPFNYATGDFAAADQQKILLATSEENAAAGIYIYSPETENINENVIIDVYQYVLDNSYDLHQYKTTLFDSTTFLTESPHIFDIPVNDVGVTLQKVFFRTGSDLGANSTLPNPANTYIGLFNDTTEYYVRYFDDASGSSIAKKFKIYLTAQNAINNENPVEFFENSGTTFYTFANKKRVSLKFDPTVDIADLPKGRWYLNTVADSSSGNIITRLKQSDYSDDSVGNNAKTSDSFFERVNDLRDKQDRVYRFRFVIPAYRGTTVRDPLNGFVFKIRTDSKRKLLPQKILLRPTGNASAFATFYALNSAGQQVNEKLGWTYSQLNAAGFDDTVYDPYLNPVKIQTNSKITASIQSARQRSINGVNYLELTVFDHDVDAAYKTTIFTTVKITAPQGGNGAFEASLTDLDSDNFIEWEGACSGSGYVHAFLNYGTEYHLILKGITGNSTLDFDPFVTTTFKQGSVSAVMMDEPDGGRTDKEKNLYAVEGANVYTLTPGDIVKDSTNVSYTIAEVTDIEDLEGTYYIFSVDTIRRRIPNQQDGVYYLTCVRGDIRPFPVGSGVGENFRNFRFSQPISKLYPEFYKNDPEWYRALDDTLKDPPETISAADNYIHGLVTVNDSKNSLTKETVLDFVQDSGSGVYSFTGDNVIQAQSGPASAGSETRRIPISGDSVYPTEKRVYVELRRPSIARSGNHTFEYLGFGPGNYSTGFPARQEIVLTDVQDFYAQAKREDAGIVFYTGLNSNGDLYIGNRKINAITGEETFLESAELVESEDEDESPATLVTTFEVPVTFKDIITVEGFDGTKQSVFTSPVYFNVRVLDDFGGPVDPAITVKTNIDPTNDDSYLNITSLGQKTGDIKIEKNSIALGMLRIYARGEQGYTIRAHISNKTPDQASPFGGDITQPSTQIIKFGSRNPVSGDVLFKGSQTDVTGAAGWIFANTYAVLSKTGDSGITNPQIANIQGFGSGNVIRLNWNTTGSPAWTNSLLGITESTQIKIVGAQSPISQINGIWRVVNTVANPFSSTANYLDVSPSEGNQITVESNLYTISTVTQPNISISKSSTSWREWGIIGSEALRTETDSIGNYKLGVNTVSRAPHSAYNNAFISLETTPRANLDVVGTAFFSGKTLSTSPNNFLANSNPTNRTFSGVSNAFLIGGDSANPDNEATFRLSTSTNRVGINVTNAELDRSLVIDGDGRVTGNFRFQADIEVNGGDITTTVTTGSFNFVEDSTFTGTLNIGSYPATVNFAARATTLNIANTTTSTQTINVGNAAANQTINVGNTGTGTHDVNIATAATGATTLDVFNSSANVRVDIGNPSASATSSKITLGGAYNANESNSYLEVKTKSAKFFGDMQIGTNKTVSDTVTLGTDAGTVNFFSTSGSASTISFGLNASVLNIGGQGGTTTVRNSLTVDASLLVKNNITLDGGTATFSFNGNRASLGSTIASHTGFPTTVPVDKNVDLVTIVSGFDNVVDTAGAGDWGGTFFQQAIPTYTGNDGTALGALSGNQYYLPLENSPTYLEGYDILIDTVVGGTRHPEIVRVASGGLRRTTTAPYYIIVERQPYGTFLPIKTNHTDGTATKRVNVALDSTWLTANVDGSGTSDVFSLSEFGGTLASGDYIFVDRNSTGTSGEAVKITSSTGSVAQKLIVTDGAGSTTFEVDSTDGHTVVSNSTALGGLDVYGPFNLISSCSATSANRLFSLKNSSSNTTWSVDMCNGETTITQGTLTTDVNVLDATATWNSSSTTFTAIKLNVTNTSSNDASKLIDLQVGSTTRFNVDASSGDTYMLGDLTVAGNDIKSSTATALTLSGANVTVAGDLTVSGNDIKSSTGDTVLTLNANDATFADNVTVGGDLTVSGGDFVVNSSSTERFAVNNDGSVDLGGINNYFTNSGGRKWLFISSGTNTDATAPSLVSNLSYILKPSGTGSLVLKLPASPQTGDMIRFVDASGGLTYNCTLVIRAPKQGTTAVPIQGDNTGTLAGNRSTVWDSGELLVNTPNAAFGLLYIGAQDGAGTAIDSAQQGWWLMEI
jgi:hypothetical protein